MRARGNACSLSSQTSPPHPNPLTHFQNFPLVCLDANPNSKYMNSALDARNIRIEGTFSTGLYEDYTGNFLSCDLCSKI